MHLKVCQILSYDEGGYLVSKDLLAFIMLPSNNRTVEHSQQQIDNLNQIFDNSTYSVRYRYYHAYMFLHSLDQAFRSSQKI